MEVGMKYYLILLKYDYRGGQGRDDTIYLDGYEIEDSGNKEYKYTFLGSTRFMNKRPGFHSRALLYDSYSRISKTIRARSLVMSVITFRQEFNRWCMSRYRNNMYLPYFLFDERGRRIEIG
jgi:hypothetical protein